MVFAKTALISLTAGILGFSAISCTSTQNKNENTRHGYSKNGHDNSGVSLHTVYFDFDKYNIRDDQRSKADAMAQSLKDNPGTKVQIQGNTDDRGSVEYNMALGTKRAESLKKYLIASGVDSDRVDIVSYGEERPSTEGENENAWAQNRRDDVVQLEN